MQKKAAPAVKIRAGVGHCWCRCDGRWAIGRVSVGRRAAVAQSLWPVQRAGVGVSLPDNRCTC